VRKPENVDCQQSMTLFDFPYSHSNCSSRNKFWWSSFLHGLFSWVPEHIFKWKARVTCPRPKLFDKEDDMVKVVHIHRHVSLPIDVLIIKNPFFDFSVDWWIWISLVDNLMSSNDPWSHFSESISFACRNFKIVMNLFQWSLIFEGRYLVMIGNEK